MRTIDQNVCRPPPPPTQLEAQFIFTGTSRHSEKDFRSYLQYLEYLSQNRPTPNAYELFAKGYEDYLQSPLQVCICLLCRLLDPRPV